MACTYSFERLTDLDACLDSIERQRHPPDEIVVVVDHNPALEAVIRPSVKVIPNAGPTGLSAARNTGLAATSSDVVVFIDDDAVAAEDWLGELIAPFDESRVAAVGGRIEPLWPSARPAWFPPHLDWTVGCTNPGWPDTVAPIRNVFGASAAFRRDALVRVGGFPVDLGRVGSDTAGCEETHVCIRIAQTADEIIVGAPRSLVRHRVTAQRARVRYVLRRCIGEGRSKARLATSVGRVDATGDERAYVVDILRAALGDLAGGLRSGRRIARAAVLLAGLASTAASYGVERASIERRRRWR